MNLVRANLKTIIISAVLVLGLVMTLYLVKNPKIFKSKADEGNVFSSTLENEEKPSSL